MLPALREPSLAPSALSPQEYEAYGPLCTEFEAQVEQLHRQAIDPNQQRAGLAVTIWDWLVPRLGGSGKTSEEDILVFFRHLSHDTQPLSVLLAMLRLVAHSAMNKHLTRDHLFIQTSPANIVESSEERSRPNPFRHPRAVSSPFPLPKESSPPSSSGATVTTRNAAPIPAPPVRWKPLSPPASIVSTQDTLVRKSSNPFRVGPTNHSYGENAPSTPPLASTVFFASPQQVTASGLTPPLPPRPKDPINLSPPKPGPKPALRQVSSDMKPPAVPKRRASTNTSSSHISVISSSTTSNVPDLPILTAKSRSSLSNSTQHIGPSATLRLSSASLQDDGILVPRRTTRSNSSVSNTSLQAGPNAMQKTGGGSHTTLSSALASGLYSTDSSPKKSSRERGGGNAAELDEEIDEVEFDRQSSYTDPIPSVEKFGTTSRPPVGATGLGRSKTIGSTSKPPPPLPPPKRRPGSVAFAQNPFETPLNISQTSKANTALTKHIRSPSLSQLSQATLSSGRKELVAFGNELTTFFERGGNKSEEWVRKKVLKNRDTSRRANERERLVDDDEQDEEDDHLETDDGAEDGADDLVGRRREFERERQSRNARDSEGEWTKLDGS